MPDSYTSFPKSPRASVSRAICLAWAHAESRGCCSLRRLPIGPSSSRSATARGSWKGSASTANESSRSPPRESRSVAPRWSTSSPRITGAPTRSKTWRSPARAATPRRGCATTTSAPTIHGYAKLSGSCRRDGENESVGRSFLAQPSTGERKLYQSMIAAPQVKPEPKATVAIFMPRCRVPSASASASMMGIVAAVVFP